MKNIQATMAGTVLNVLVQQGDEVKAGDTVIMLESMKMEIPVEVTDGGVIKEIKVDVADFVNEGDTLLIVE